MIASKANINQSNFPPVTFRGLFAETSNFLIGGPDE